jgi:hypothetical protein
MTRLRITAALSLLGMAALATSCTPTLRIAGANQPIPSAMPPSPAPPVAEAVLADGRHHVFVTSIDPDEALAFFIGNDGPGIRTMPISPTAGIRLLAEEDRLEPARLSELRGVAKAPYRGFWIYIEHGWIVEVEQAAHHERV